MSISSKNILTETVRIMFDHISGHSGPAKLMHKINCHIQPVSHPRTGHTEGRRGLGCSHI